MSTTTQILFNSPALHSLKREQLVKLCKIHSIKASGKNAELIERLKQRAQELPQSEDGTLHIGGLTFPSDVDVPRFQMPRPSEQWEIVMEDIEEVQESTSLGTISSKGSLRTQGTAGEFGTSNSKSSTVGTSIKALATSLGIKRATSTKSSNSEQRPPSIWDGSRQDELTKHAVPYSELPPAPSLPRTDAAVDWNAGANADGDVSMSAPVPGSPSRPGAPAPANARLSMGNKGATTTIRLISAAQRNDHDAPGTPQLPPFQTNFDLEMGSPAPGASPGHRPNVWPASPGNTLQGRRLYPLVPFEDMVGGGTMTAGTLPHPHPHAARDEDDAARMPGGILTFTNATPAKVSAPLFSKPTPQPADAPDMFSPMRPPHANAVKPAPALRPRSEPFLFGSPLPRHSLSNKEFGDAAASVLEEMNRRVAEARAAKGGEAKAPARGVQDAFADVFSANDRAHQRTGSTDRFAKAHEDAFGKMDSIVNHYAARRPPQAQAQPNSKKRKSDALGIGPAPGAKRKSSAAGARVISAGVRKKMGVPGAFGADEDNDNDNDNDGDDDGSEEDPGDRRSSKRIRTTSGNDVHSGQRVSLAPSAGADPDAEDLKKQKEREAIRRKLDANKARRRSSRGRVSIGGKPPAGKAKTSRFGFLASAKSLVRNVWNMGAGASKDTKPAAQPSSTVPVAKPAQAPQPAPTPKPAAGSSAATRKQSTGADNVSVRSAATTARTTTGTASSRLSQASNSTTASKNTASTSSSRQSMARVRAPIPSFSSASKGTKPPDGAASSRTSVAARPSSSTTSRTSVRPSSIAGASSLGTRSSLVSAVRGPVTSMGAKRSISGSGGTGVGTTGSTRTMSSDAVDGSGSDAPTVKKRSSSLMAPTASSMAKRQSTVRAGAETSGRPPGLSAVAEQTARPAPAPSRRPSGNARSPKKTTLGIITNSPRSPRLIKIFDKPLTTTTFSSPSSPTSPPAHKPSLSAAVNAIMGTPSRIPRLAVPPKPKALVARKPRVSRSRVIAKMGAQRAPGQPALATTVAPAARTRSSMGGRKSLGGVKGGRQSAGAEVIKSAVKKRARQSECAARRRSRAAADSRHVQIDDHDMTTAIAMDTDP
ncbi:hypothetical protein POSPLADRAFT_1076508 [Postia placenta MAD-698-R-SB12]|uniref:SAP domain-containing protein n=1 Tax=Postia placenta MAD-698-R-SB12 TaxID=670580 RepID=A0A1X6MKD1_9APHY|nr:hypothetical protein POSPLADRAFT_1076508 [Postia placenta MAD-698-R-SB12]OSX56854.1 hypothetical protein POSPLADRAFT_1076508 [Postia placenta MAD-698-R-SB12]